MGKKGKKRYLVLAVFVLIAAGAFLWVRWYVFERLGLGLHERIQTFHISGFNIRYDSISVDWLSGLIEIDNLVLEKNAYDTTCIYPEFVSVGKVRAEGIGFFQLIFRKELSLEMLSLERPRVVMRRNSQLKLDSAGRRKNEFTLQVGEVRVAGADIMYTDSAHCETITSFKSNLALRGLKMEFLVDRPLEYSAGDLTFDSTEVGFPGSYYTFKIRHARLDFDHQNLRADSIRVIPHLGKIEFGKKQGFEIDRFESLIPFISLTNISLAALDTGFVQASSAEIQFYLKVFRDKRLKSVAKQKFLPIEQIQNLPFGLAIDSLKVTKSYVQYEEFAEDAPEAGNIFFDNLYAMIYNITNVSKEGDARLKAYANLWGQGELSLFVTFPLDKNKKSSARGWIKDFDIPAINPMLTPNTQLKIESGRMKELLFNFTFNDIRSDGEIELNYENLKLVTFKDESKKPGKEPGKDNLKTFIINTFVFRKNMDENVPEEKRKGTIMYERDETKSIFNFWSKSLISGIKSAYKLDKMEAKKNDRDAKKEERLSKREAKKSKRAEKKKERG